MKVLQINTFGTGSTGHIAVDLCRSLIAEGNEGIVAYSRGTISGDIPHIRIGSDLNVKVHGLMTRITDKTGFYSTESTKLFLKKIDEYDPDIIHLHNLHGYYINIALLFEYLKKRNKPVIWTLHDCWAFTGHCAYFTMAGCDKWKTECNHCPQKYMYPKSIIYDNSLWNYQKKRELFTGLKNLTLVTPSKWLAGLVKQSFLKEYPVKVIYNGIDLKIFKPRRSNFRERYGLQDKFIVLGVANDWDKRKGLEDFVRLSSILDDRFKIVVVGINNKQRKLLPSKVIGISRTNNVQELAEIYSAADVYFNASKEETMGLTTVEATACGTPVVVYDATAIPEVVDEVQSEVVEKGNLEKVMQVILKMRNESSTLNKFSSNGFKYDKLNMQKQYLNLYKDLSNGYIEY